MNLCKLVHRALFKAIKLEIRVVLNGSYPVNSSVQSVKNFIFPEVVQRPTAFTTSRI